MSWNDPPWAQAMLIVEPIEPGTNVIETGGGYSPDVPTDPGAGVTATPAVEPAAAEPAAAEPAAEPAKAEPAESELSRSWAALKRSEREIWKREKALKDAKPAPDFSSPKAAMDALKAAGISLDDMIDAHLDTAELSSKPAREVDPDVAELKKWKADREKQEADQSARATYDSGVTALTEGMKAQGDRFELLLADGAHDRVFAKIREHVEEFGKPPEWTDAADAVEAELQAEHEQRFERVLNTKKFQSKYVRAAQQPNSHSPVAKPPRRTITNESVTRGRTEQADDLPLDPDLRDREIRKRFQMR